MSILSMCVSVYHIEISGAFRGQKIESDLLKWSYRQL